SQENASSSQTSSSEKIYEKFGRSLSESPELDKGNCPSITIVDPQMRDRMPTELDYLTVELLKKNYNLSCRLCGCVLNCWSSHCVIPSRCSHMFCFNCGGKNLKLPSTDVHHEVIDKLTLGERDLIKEYEELLELHHSQPIVSSERMLIPWNITTYQIPGTEMLFGCKFQTRTPKPCPTCGLLSTEYWEIIPPPTNDQTELTPSF
ncbi:hypothetical protein SNEBB_005035, partial [Seison nebaliae]